MVFQRSPCERDCKSAYSPSGYLSVEEEEVVESDKSQQLAQEKLPEANQRAAAALKAGLKGNAAPAGEPSGVSYRPPASDSFYQSFTILDVITEAESARV